jgi:alkylresorcinol/alkylpyrone synthase
LGEPHGWPERTEVFSRVALELLERVARDCLRSADIGPGQIDAIVVASTTGLAVPSLDALLAERMGLRADVERLPLFGIGCAAGVTGLARAVRLARTMPDAHVLFLCVELCTINGRVGDHRLENFVSSVLLRTLDAHEESKAHATFGASGEHRWPNSRHVMGWSIEDDGFGVILSPDVPAYAGKSLKPALDAFLAKHGLTRADIAGFVVHPGGRKVLEGVEAALELPRAALRHSWSVLHDLGNMSSPTVLFILERALAERPCGRHLLVAFGPGFSASFLVLDLPDVG